MTTDTRRKDTIHHIDPTSNPLHEILRCPDSHEVVGLVGWQDRREDIQYSIHILLALTY
jgi:hypothetical protein